MSGKRAALGRTGDWLTLSGGLGGPLYRGRPCGLVGMQRDFGLAQGQDHYLFAFDLAPPPFGRPPTPARGPGERIWQGMPQPARRVTWRRVLDVNDRSLRVLQHDLSLRERLTNRLFCVVPHHALRFDVADSFGDPLVEVGDRFPERLHLFGRDSLRLLDVPLESTLILTRARLDEELGQKSATTWKKAVRSGCCGCWRSSALSTKCVATPAMNRRGLPRRS